MILIIYFAPRAMILQDFSWAYSYTNLEDFQSFFSKFLMLTKT